VRSRMSLFEVDVSRHLTEAKFIDSCLPVLALRIWDANLKRGMSGTCSVLSSGRDGNFGYGWRGLSDQTPSKRGSLGPRPVWLGAAAAPQPAGCHSPRGAGKANHIEH
jgi:hypothetical protein